MKNIFSKSLRNKFIFGLILMLLPLTAPVIGAILTLQDATKILNHATHEASQELRPILILQMDLAKASMPANDYIIHSDPSERDLFSKISKRIDNDFEVLINSGQIAYSSEQDLLRLAYNEWNLGKILSNNILSGKVDLKSKDAASEMEKLDAHIEKSVEIIQKLNNSIITEIEEHIKETEKVKRNTIWIMLTTLVIGSAIALAIGVVLSSSILNPIFDLKEGAILLAGGDLSYRVKVKGNDEITLLAESFNEMAISLEQNEKDLRILSTHDELTGLYNRRKFQRLICEEMGNAMNNRTPLSLLMVDLDSFKLINDTYGHQAGDIVLKTVASTISNQVRPCDHVARYGGDEFILILPEATEEVGEIIAQKIHRNIMRQEIFLSPDQIVKVTVSIGVAELKSNQSEHDFILAADTALYRVKSLGRNSVLAFSDI